MKISTITDVLGMADGEGVTCFKGTVKTAGKFFPVNPKVKDSQSFQAVTVSDGERELKLILKNQPTLPLELVGKLIHVTARKGDKGWSGVKVKDQEDPKTKIKVRVLWVTASATITGGSEVGPPGNAVHTSLPQTPQDAPGAAEATGSQSGAGKPPTGQPGAKSGSSRRRSEYIPGEEELAGSGNSDPWGEKCDRLTEDEAVREAARVCWRSHNAMMLALRAAEATRKQYQFETGKELWPDQFRVITSTYYLTLRDGGVVQWLPPRELTLEDVTFITVAPSMVERAPVEGPKLETTAQEPEPQLSGEEVPW